MRLPPHRPLAQLAGVAALAAVLALLALLQYRWSLEISRAEKARIESALNTSVSQFRQEFHRELVQICSAFHSDPGTAPESFLTAYADGYQAWARTAAHPELIVNVYVWRSDPDAASHLLLLRPADDQFEPVEWPAPLTGLRDRLQNELSGAPPPPGPEVRMFSWTFEEQIPALVHAITEPSIERWLHRPAGQASAPHRPPRDDHGPGPRPPRLQGFLILELSAPAFEQHLLADLAQRYFGGPDGFTYNVAILSGDPSGSLIYRSAPELTKAALDPPDARSPLLASSPADYRAIAGNEPQPPRPRSGRGGQGRGFSLRARTPIILSSPAGEPWQLWARHRGGSLESVVAADRRRNLALSFGVLLLLAVSMALVILSAQRARRLARLQIEFVAGVSHELRTPVAVICAAADNLAEGFIGAKEQVKEYGAVIRNEGRRLAGMVEQILRFAAGQAGRTTYDLQPIQVSEAVDTALQNISGLPEAEGFHVEREIAPDLPPVRADAAALAACVQNLLLNAMKYGGERRWVKIRAMAENGGVRLGVEDRGLGIDPADLPHIFEPFYRGKAAQAAQIHGAGLGLSLSRDIAEAMGGHLTAASELGRGSIFTLELPAAA